MAKEEFFNDVQELRDGSLGVLGGDGAAYLEKTKTETTTKGIETACPCGSCGKPNVITVEYGEAITGGEGLIPDHWEFDQKSGSIFPNVGCAHCNYQLKLLFTPKELKSLMSRAVNEGVVDGNQVVAATQRIRQQKAAMAGRR